MEKEYGIVYVLSNPWMPGLVKIGKTTSTRLKARMQNLYSTGVPAPFKVEFSCSLGLSDYSDVEAALHNAFANQRVNKNREFFQIEPERVIPLLEIFQKTHKTYHETTSQLQKQIEQYQAELEESNAHDGEDGDEVLVLTPEPTKQKEAKPEQPVKEGVIKVYHYSKKKNIDAEGEYDVASQKVILKKGSKITHDCVKSLSKANVKKHQEIALECKDAGNCYITQKDYVFNSASGASSIALGRPSNGFDDWYIAKNTEENKKAGLVKSLNQINVRQK